MPEVVNPMLLKHQQHQQQHQVAAAAFSFLDAANSSTSSGDDVARAAALASLRGLIRHPESAQFLRRSGVAIARALEQLLLDKAFVVKQAAAITYGALGAISTELLVSDNGQLGIESSGGFADLFMGWARPRLTDSTYKSELAVLALAGLQEFFATGDIRFIENLVPSILAACQGLLENEMPLLEPLLGVLTVCGVRFSHRLESYFADMVDLLLGWALDPEHPEGDRRLIVDSFLQFEPMWARSPQFPLSLLTKFLGDMEMLAQDHSTPTLQQLHRLLALASCFVAIMQATALGMDEAASTKLAYSKTNTASVADLPLASESGQHIVRVASLVGSSKVMLPRVVSCFAILGEKFRDFRWLNEACRCLTLFAEVLREDFAEFYPSVLKILFPVSGLDSRFEIWQQNSSVGLALEQTSALSAPQVQLILQVHMRVIACQGQKLPAGAVSKLLGWSSPLSHLRLHPSRFVRGTVAATYLLLLRHGSKEVATEARRCLSKELELLKDKKFTFFRDRPCFQESFRREAEEQRLSDSETTSLFKFDLMLMLYKSLSKEAGALGVLQTEKTSGLTFGSKVGDPLSLSVVDLKFYILGNLNPFQVPLQWHPNLQLILWQVLHWHCTSGNSRKFSHLGAHREDLKDREVSRVKDEVDSNEINHAWLASSTFDFDITGFSLVIALATDSHASLLLKLEALRWVRMFAISNCTANLSVEQVDQNGNEGHNLQLLTRLPSILLTMAFDKEPRVRAGVAAVLEIFMQNNLVKPSQLQPVTLVALTQLKDPESFIQAAFQRVVEAYGPAALWIYGWQLPAKYGQGFYLSTMRTVRSEMLHGKQFLSNLHSVRYLRVQQLSWILNYLSQRTQVLPAEWLQRLISNSILKIKTSSTSNEDEDQESVSGRRCEEFDEECVSGELEPVEKWTSSGLLALWWAVQEASRHCVTVRLRTHLGGPTQTFAALERMLLDVPPLCRIDFGQRETAFGGMASPSTVQLLSLRLLLEFVEALKKDIYNAYEGSLVLSPAPTLSSLFFRANRKVCEEWFARIREAFINASVATQCHAGTILHAALHLQDLRAIISPSLRDPRGQLMSENSHSIRGSIQGDLMKVMQHACLALCRSHEADALHGLKVWVKSAFASVVIEEHLSAPRTGSSLGPFAWLDGLTFQAKGQFEKAVAHYNQVLQLNEALVTMGADGIQFTIARTIESYVALADWESLDLWVQELQLLRANHAGKAYCGALTTSGNDMNAVYALARFDGGDAHGAWGYLDLTPQSRSEFTADPWQALHRSEQTLLQVMLQQNTESDKFASQIALARAMVEDCCQVAMLDGLAQATPYLLQLECVKVYESFRNANSSEDRLNGSSSLSSPHSSWPLDHMHQDCQPWLKLLRVHRVVCPRSFRTFQLQRQLVRLARKQLNLRLARRLLNEILEFQIASVSREMGTLANSPCHLERLLYEDILLLHAEEKKDEAVLKLWQFVQNKVNFEVPNGEAINGSTNAKACLKLGRWLCGSDTQPNMSTTLSMLGFDVDESEVNFPFFDHKDRTRLNNNETFVTRRFETAVQQIVGAAIKGATICSPEMAKAWFTYGYWCFAYAQGSHSIVNLSSRDSFNFLDLIDGELKASRTELTSEEVASIRLIVSNLAAGSDSDNLRQSIPGGRNDLETSIQHIITAFITAARSAGSEDIEGEPPSYVLSLQLQHQLQMISTAWSVSPVIPELMRLWWALRCRKVSLYMHSARGFLQYLAVSNQGRMKGSLLEQVKPEREDCMLSASLYLLRIIVNYGVELEDSLQPGLLLVPPSSWQAISAQILARLNSHPESRVRNQLKGLLMASANLSPRAIVYPLLVDMNGSDQESSEELKDLRDCLIKLHPKLARDVKSMVSELGAITIFWDEQWLSTLQDLRSDVMRRITTLKHETARVAENATLSQSEKVRINAAKYLAMMAPVVVALERRLASTSRPQENPRQAWFQEQFGSSLKRAIEIFKAPPVGSASLSGVWRPFDVITADLVSHQKKSIIPLSDVSPGLTALQSSEAPMPGLGVHSSIADRSSFVVFEEERSPITTFNRPDIITVASFSSHVTVLSTKTKPKKLQIMGSDGGAYPYLLKGREDLRLDARIMQLLQAVNSMLLVRCETRRRGLTVRHYSVTPISGRAGLIQWIEDLTSMYSVYKAWQERTVIASGANIGNGLPSVPRPSDLFYGKIIPALKEKGLRKVISRRDWPQDVKRNVLLELVQETPRQLLHNELWCASEGLSSFRAKVDHFSGSVAVVSIVGYILGLGDRHLDNILVDFRSGDVVHIDYNVCFDKGLRLKIPEIVPFRLTHTIQAALGLTGVEGVFRTNCEAVFRVLQSNKEVLLMLLQVFIWDPLVEWMRGDGHDEAVIGGEERKGMELAVSLSLFASRLQEIRVPLQDHHDQLLLTLPAAAMALESLVEADDRLEQSVALYTQAEQKRRAAVHAEGAAMSLFVEATSDLDKAQEVFSAQAQELEKTKVLVIEAARKLIHWVKQHASVLEALRLGSLPEIDSIGQAVSSPEILSLKSAVLTAGVPLTIIPEAAQVHCQEIDRDMALLTSARHEALLLAVQSLKAYSAVLQRLVPANYVSSSHVHSWAEVLQVLSQDLSFDVLAVAKRRAADLIAQCHGVEDESVHQKYKDARTRFERLFRDLQKLQGDLNELEVVTNPEAFLKSKDRFLATVAAQFQHLARDNGSGEAEEQSRFILVLHKAASTLYRENWDGMKRLQYRICKQGNAFDSNMGDPGDKWFLEDLRISIDKWTLLADVIVELGKVGAKAGGSLKLGFPTWLNPQTLRTSQWAFGVSTCVSAIGKLHQQMEGSVFPEVVSAAMSQDAGLVEAFTAFAHIRENVDRTLQQDLDFSGHRRKNYGPKANEFSNAGEAKRRQAWQEDAGAEGIGSCSWEDSVSSQRELRGRIDTQFHMSLETTEQRFSMLMDINNESNPHNKRRMILIAAFAQLLSRLESLDEDLSSLLQEIFKEDQFGLADEGDLGTTEETGNVWKDPRLSQKTAFFVWKVRVMEALLDICVSAMQDPPERILQLEMKLKSQLLRFLAQYVGQRLMSALLLLVKEAYPLTTPGISESPEEEWKLEHTAERALRLLREYCNAHDSVKAANAASFTLRSQAEERLQALDKAHMEAAQMEWLNELTLSSSFHQNQFLGVPRSMRGDKQGVDVAWWSRPQVRNSLYAASTAIRQATEGLQGREKVGVAAEGELERAMASAWTSPGPNQPASGHRIGVPTEFYDYIHRRRQLLRSSHEQAVNVLRLCESVLEFEASRDGFLSITPGDGLQSSTERGRLWQQTYYEVVSRLESAYISFSRLKTDWQSTLVQLESARADLSKVASELQSASSEAESASGEVKVSILDFKAWIQEAAARVSAVSNIVKIHTALTLDAGQMLEEVLVITEGTEGAEDVHGLAQEASAEHTWLMAKLNKVNELILPLEPLLTSGSLLASKLARLSTSGLSFTEGMVERSSAYGHISVEPNHYSLRDTSVALSETVSSLLGAVKNLHSCLSKLIRTASSDAGFLHKALAGVGGENQEERSPQVVVAISDSHEEFAQPDLNGKSITRSGHDMEPNLPIKDENAVLQMPDNCWISPPDSGHSVTYTDSYMTSSSPDKCRGLKMYQNGKSNAKVLSKGIRGDELDMGTFPDGSDTSLDLSSPPASSTTSTLVRSQQSGMEHSRDQESSVLADDSKEEHHGGIHKGSEYLHRLAHPKEPKMVGPDRMQGKNAYAISVLKRVQMKLEGQEVDGSRKHPVAEQVDILLRQATGIDNLSNMYEGWTPWV